MNFTSSLLVLCFLTAPVLSLVPQSSAMANAEKSIAKSSPSANAKPLSSGRRRQKWGVDNSHPDEYWFDQRIHTLGNVGLGGAFHAALAPFSTKLIDILAYDGVDIRSQVSKAVRDLVSAQNAKVIDLCCGVGMSTRALRDAFPETATVMGMDTSSEMVAMAQFLSSHLEAAKRDLNLGFLNPETYKNMCSKTIFQEGNAEDTKLPANSFDLVTVMYAFHEAPHDGRSKILAEARRLLNPGGKLVVVDISSEYEPSGSMLMGEPYVLEYQKSIHQQLKNAAGFLQPKHTNLVEQHVDMWVLQRSPA